MQAVTVMRQKSSLPTPRTAVTQDVPTPDDGGTGRAHGFRVTLRLPSTT